MRKTKIVCTLGPATDKDNVLEELIKNGLNVARCNFSHGSHEEHLGRMNKVKELREKCNKPVAILLDTKGPEIRTGNFENGKVHVFSGQTFTLVGGEKIIGDENRVNITYPDLYKDVEPGSVILIDDGLIKMEVEKIVGQDVVCKVKNDGKISDKKGVNVPDIHINMEYLSEQDKKDIIFGIEQDVDYIAASFVRCAEDVEQIRAILKENGGENINIIAKIENSEGILNIDSIIEAADGIMVARGDMGVELPEEEVPIIQKMIIKKVYQAGKKVITATQMLDSMINNPRPTRSQTTDVANAIYDGTIERNITQAVCHATCTTAYDLEAKAILTVTKSGRSARMISSCRPDCMVIAGTTDEKTCRQLSLSWGVTPVLLKEKEDVLELFDYAVEVAKENKLVNQGDIVVITSGVPLGTSGTTNMMKVQTVE